MYFAPERINIEFFYW